jgi:hypothetical protein
MEGMLVLIKIREILAFRKIQEGGREKNRFVLGFRLVYHAQIFYLFIPSLSYGGLLLISGQQFASRLQMTEDELVVHFFQFDGNFCHHCILCVCACRYWGEREREREREREVCISVQRSNK